MHIFRLLEYSCRALSFNKKTLQDKKATEKTSVKEKKKGFSYLGEGYCFCMITNRNLLSGREEFHVQEQAFGIGSVRKTNQRCPTS